MNKARAKKYDDTPTQPKLRVIDGAYAKKHPTRGERMESGVVEEVTGKEYAVRLQSVGACKAKRAAGCLLTPEPGDTILVFFQPQGTHYIMNVLEKGTKDWNLSCEGNVCLESANGACAVRGRKVNIAGTDELTLAANTVEVVGVRGAVRFLNVTFWAKGIESVAARVVQRIGRCLRRVEYENTKAGRVKMRVDERFEVKAKDACVLAEKDVSIDGERILLS